VTGNTMQNGNPKTAGGGGANKWISFWRDQKHWKEKLEAILRVAVGKEIL